MGRLFIILFFLVLAAFPALSEKAYSQVTQSSVDPTQLAVCLSEKNFIMYGRDGCSACALEKEYFGEAFQYINFVNCTESFEKELLCKNRGIKGFPTWESQSGEHYLGAIPLPKLAEISGCVQRTEIGEQVTQTATEVKGSFRSFMKEYGWIFLAGLISFFAPCLIPLMPSYLSTITGYTFSELYGLEFSKIRGKVFKNALFFVLGFAVVFTFLGATGSVFGQLINNYLPILLKLSGVLMILMGLVQLQIIKPPSWEFDYAWTVQRKLTKLGFLSSAITGTASALAWIPCVGPILGSVLLLAADSQSVPKGMSYLFVYSLGVMFPFLLAALFFPKFFDAYQERRHILKYFSVISGLIIIVFGLVLVFDKYAEFINIYYSTLKSIGIDFSLERLLVR